MVRIIFLEAVSQLVECSAECYSHSADLHRNDLGNLFVFQAGKKLQRDNRLFAFGKSLQLAIDFFPGDGPVCFEHSRRDTGVDLSQLDGSFQKFATTNRLPQVGVDFVGCDTEQPSTKVLSRRPGEVTNAARNLQENFLRDIFRQCAQYQTARTERENE